MTDRSGCYTAYHTKTIAKIVAQLSTFPVEVTPSWVLDFYLKERTVDILILSTQPIFCDLFYGFEHGHRVDPKNCYKYRCDYQWFPPTWQRQLDMVSIQFVFFLAHNKLYFKINLSGSFHWTISVRSSGFIRCSLALYSIYDKAQKKFGLSSK